MASLRRLLYGEVTGLTHGRDMKFGDRTDYETLTPTNGEVYQSGSVVADNYQEEVLWAAGDGGLADFEVAIVETDYDVVIELRDGTNYATIEAKAGIGAIFGGQIASDNASAMPGDGSAETMGDVDQITVKRNAADAAGDAYVLITLIG